MRSLERTGDKMKTAIRAMTGRAASAVQATLVLQAAWALQAALALVLSGCVVHETRPLPKINAAQAGSEIPEDELLAVAVHVFDPGVPPEIAKNEQALNRKRIYPDIRAAESRYVAMMLRGTLENSGQWGAVSTLLTRSSRRSSPT